MLAVAGSSAGESRVAAGPVALGKEPSGMKVDAQHTRQGSVHFLARRDFASGGVGPRSVAGRLKPAPRLLFDYRLSPVLSGLLTYEGARPPRLFFPVDVPTTFLFFLFSSLRSSPRPQKWFRGVYRDLCDQAIAIAAPILWLKGVPRDREVVRRICGPCDGGDGHGGV